MHRLANGNLRARHRGSPRLSIVDLEIELRLNLSRFVSEIESLYRFLRHSVSLMETNEIIRQGIIDNKFLSKSLQDVNFC